MKKTLKLAALLGAVVLAVGMSPVFAQQPSPRGGGMMGGDGPGMHGRGGPGDFLTMRILHELDLTDDQRGRIRDIVQTYRAGDLGTAAGAMRDAHHALEVAIWSTGSTETSISDAVQSLSTKIAALAEVRHHMAGEISSVLTDEQRARLQTLLEEPPPEPGMGPGAGKRGGMRRSR